VSFPSTVTSDRAPRSGSARRSARPVVAITGASSGVGRACVRAFAEHGYDIGMIARGEHGLAAGGEEARTLGARTCVVTADVADAAAVDQTAERIEDALGPLEVWVNNAMAAVFAPFLDVTPEEFDRVMAVTFGGQVNGTRAALTRMRSRDRGTIVQVGSALAYRGIPLQSGYCAAKHATQGLCDSLRAELIHDRSRVHVTMVQLRPSTPPSSTCNATSCHASRSRCRRSSSQSLPPRPSSSPPSTAAARCGWACRPSGRSSGTGSCPASWTACWAAPGTPPSSAEHRPARMPRTSCSRRPGATRASTAPSTTGRGGTAFSCVSPSHPC
jgi:NAD(P)-dependent dehydrogenase (short-subunit alcohol dehydrogenase family)